MCACVSIDFGGKMLLQICEKIIHFLRVQCYYESELIQNLVC